MKMKMRTLAEESGKFFMGKNIITPKNELLDEIQKIKEEKEVEELGKKLLEIDKLKQEDINKKLETLELVPIGNKIIILPYPRNPYRRIISENGIIIDYDGTFKNPDTGEMDTLKEGIKCAKVIEVGPDCKFLKVGDDVYFDDRTVYPLPFMSMGYKLTTEPQIFCVINEKVKERFKM